MPRVEWPLRHGRPCIEIVLTVASSRQPISRTVLADTGAGSLASGIDLILDEHDCPLCGGLAGSSITLSSAYVGSFPVYVLPVQLPALGFANDVRAVGVPSISGSFDGIACFGFLNLFHYGNFGKPSVFGLEV